MGTGPRGRGLRASPAEAASRAERGVATRLPPSAPEEQAHEAAHAAPGKSQGARPQVQGPIGAHDDVDEVGGEARAPARGQQARGVARVPSPMRLNGGRKLRPTMSVAVCVTPPYDQRQPKDHEPEPEAPLLTSTTSPSTGTQWSLRQAMWAERARESADQRAMATAEEESGATATITNRASVNHPYRASSALSIRRPSPGLERATECRNRRGMRTRPSYTLSHLASRLPRPGRRIVGTGVRGSARAGPPPTHAIVARPGEWCKAHGSPRDPARADRGREGHDQRGERSREATGEEAEPPARGQDAKRVSGVNPDSAVAPQAQRYAVLRLVHPAAELVAHEGGGARSRIPILPHQLPRHRDPAQPAPDDVGGEGEGRAGEERGGQGVPVAAPPKRKGSVSGT